MDEDINKEKSPVFYMANLGVEVARIFSWKEKNDSDMIHAACERAKKIINYLLNSPSNGAKEEGKTLSDIIDDIVSVRPTNNITAESLNTYFMPFMLKANEMNTC